MLLQDHHIRSFFHPSLCFKNGNKKQHHRNTNSEVCLHISVPTSTVHSNSLRVSDWIWGETKIMINTPLEITTSTWVTTVDGRNPAPVEVGSLSYYLQGFYTSQVVIAGFLSWSLQDASDHKLHQEMVPNRETRRRQVFGAEFSKRGGIEKISKGLGVSCICSYLLFFYEGNPINVHYLLLACFGQDPIYSLENNDTEPILMIQFKWVVW